jgi:hypothetical protein
MSQARVSITPADAWSDQRLTPLQCRLLGLIGSYLGKDHKAWPSQNTLAGQLGVTRKAVNDGVKALREYGYVQVQKRTREDGGQTSNCYFVVMDPVSRSGDIPCEAEVTPQSPYGDTPCNPMEVTPPVTPKGDTMKDPIERPNEECVGVDEAFERIWSAWSSAGRGRSKSKANCKAILKRLSKANDVEVITRAALHYAKLTDGQFHKGMHSWLTGGFWEQWVGKSVGQQSELTREDWQAAMREYVDTGEWPIPAISPPPTDPACKAPADMIQAYKKHYLTGDAA